MERIEYPYCSMVVICKNNGKVTESSEVWTTPRQLMRQSGMSYVKNSRLMQGVKEIRFKSTSDLTPGNYWISINKADVLKAEFSEARYISWTANMRECEEWKIAQQCYHRW